MFINYDNFNAILGYFRVACLKNNVQKPAIVNLIDLLELKKEILCNIGSPKLINQDAAQPEN